MRILIAEDNLTSRIILTGILKKWGHEVVAVKDSQAARRGMSSWWSSQGSRRKIVHNASKEYLRRIP